MSSYISCPFVKEILEIWSEIFFYEKITSEEVFSKLPVWHNSLIRMGNKPVFYKDWYSKGITKVKHLYDNSADLLSWSDFQNKYNLKFQPLTYFGIVSAINRLNKSKDLPKHDCSLKKFLESATPSRFAYGKLISSKSEQPHICQHKWSNDINLPPDEKIDWRAVYQLAFQYTINFVNNGK